jgi:hypothetical protein
MYKLQITVTALYKARNVFVRSKAGILSSNANLGMAVCLRLFCVFVGNGLATS